MNEDVQRIGDQNNAHGICGFVSCFTAQYFRLKQRRDVKRIYHTRNVSTGRNLAHIIDNFLDHCAKHHGHYLGEIETFTREFGNSRNTGNAFSIRAFRERLKNTLASTGVAVPYLDIAMPPSAVLYYLHEFQRFPGARSVAVGTQCDPCIVGLADGTIPQRFYGGLGHWVFYKDNVIYSWGEEYRGQGFAGALTTLNEKSVPTGEEPNTFTPCQKIKF